MLCALVDSALVPPEMSADLRRQRRRCRSAALRACHSPAAPLGRSAVRTSHHDEVVMKRHILAGLVLALLTTAIVLFSGPELQGVALLGAALGGALGLVPDRTPAQRAAGFGVGFLAAWLG